MTAPNHDPITLAREVLAGGDESDDRFLDFFEARNIAQTLARAVIEPTAERDTPAGRALMAEGWDERHKARPDYSQGHDDDCMGWEDCRCGRYVNPYRP